VDEKSAQELVQSVLGGTELRPVVLSLPASNVVPRVVGTIKEVVMRHLGPLPMRVRVVNGDSPPTTLELPVTVASSVRAELRATFGPHACEER